MANDPPASREPDKPAAPPNAGAWLARHGDLLYRIARLHGANESVAEDLVQDTLLAGLSGWSKFDGRSALATWLVSILRNKLVDHFRSRSRAEQALSSAEFEPNEFTVKGLWRSKMKAWRDPDRDLSDREFWDVFSACLADIPPDQRVAFVMRELDAVESEEICQVLHVSRTNLWTLLHRARSRLRLCLEKNWFGGPPS